jgi:hypothetical protein
LRKQESDKVMRTKKLSAHRRAQRGLDYRPPPPPSEAERTRSTWRSLLRVLRMVLLHQIFTGGK